ncbi:hypothetical protein lerEdw1_013203 [Lerista edwardsae]|nr:hypothetical protein lerEdw1_013203 [Lerista edwardsae]
MFVGADSLYRNSLSFSDEKLNSPTLSATAVSTPTVASPKAKLGDTKELEDFIADLDRTLAMPTYNDELYSFDMTEVVVVTWLY